jgi:hypothetical protein
VSTDPIFSRGALKALGVLLVALVLGGGAYALAGGGIGIDLPDIDLPETTTGDGSATQLSNTTLENTTIEGPTAQQPATDPFTSAAFATAIDKVRAETGPGAKLTRLFINPVQTQFIVRRGEGIEAYSVRADNGEVTRQEATITVSGNATIDDFAFALDAIEPAAVDRMLAKARKLSKAADFEPTVLNLERDLSAGLKPPEWTINAQGAGHNLTLKANENGSGVKNVGSEGTAIPQAALDAQKLNQCIQDANQDFDAIQKCLEEFSG